MEQRPEIISHVSYGWRRLLESPSVFNFWQRIAGAHSWKKRLIKDYVQPKGKEKILDVGCGTGPILSILDKNLKIDYVGCDINSEYIEHAKKHHAPNGRFYCCSVDRLPADESGFDVILAIAIFHHLDDKTSRLLIQSVKEKLRPEGFFLMAEPVYSNKQSSLERFLMGKDRGQNIRTESEYHQLLESEFIITESKIIFDSHIIPWTVNVIICK